MSMRFEVCLVVSICLSSGCFFFPGDICFFSSPGLSILSSLFFNVRDVISMSRVDEAIDILLFFGSSEFRST